MIKMKLLILGELTMEVIACVMSSYPGGTPSLVTSNGHNCQVSPLESHYLSLSLEEGNPASLLKGGMLKNLWTFVKANT